MREGGKGRWREGRRQRSGHNLGFSLNKYKVALLSDKYTINSESNQAGTRSGRYQAQASEARRLDLTSLV